MSGIDHLLDTNVVIGPLKGHAPDIALAEAEAIRLRRSGALKLPDAIIAATVRLSGARLLSLDQRLMKIVAL